MQLTHLDESEQLRSMRVLQSSHVHGIFRAQAYFLDKASKSKSKSSAAGGRRCVRTGGAATASPTLFGLRYPVAHAPGSTTKSDKVFCARPSRIKFFA